MYVTCTRFNPFENDDYINDDDDDVEDELEKKIDFHFSISVSRYYATHFLFTLHTLLTLNNIFPYSLPLCLPFSPFFLLLKVYSLRVQHYLVISC